MLIEMPIYLKIKRVVLVILSLITLSTLIDSVDFSAFFASAYTDGGCKKTDHSIKFFVSLSEGVNSGDRSSDIIGYIESNDRTWAGLKVARQPAKSGRC
jgi:hypothetical protein